MKNDIPKVNSRYNENAVIGSLLVENSPLHENIGKKVRFKNPTCLSQRELFIILGVQKDYSGKLCYRVYVVTGGYNDTFGRCASPDEITFVI